jgi:hypothetical protein
MVHAGYYHLYYAEKGKNIHVVSHCVTGFILPDLRIMSRENNKKVIFFIFIDEI